MNQMLDVCLCCGSDELVECLDLGTQPLANSYRLPTDPPLHEYPLAIRVCKHCFHAQLTSAVDPDELFKNYLYVSGTSDTLKQYFRDLVTKINGYYPRPGKMLDIAANDGTFMEIAREQGWDVVGVDPASNLQTISRAHGLNVIEDYWTTDLATEIGTVDCIVAQNVLAHVADPLEFLKACAIALSDHGKLFVQTSQCHWFKRGQYDYWYHEHISAFTVRSMKALLERAGLFLEAVEVAPIHGDSYLFVISKTGDRDKEFETEQEEYYSRRYSLEAYAELAEKVTTSVETFRMIINYHRGNGYKIIGYGAAAKANTMLNFAKISLDYIVDENPLKLNRLTPGMDIPIRNVDELMNEPNDVVVVPLAWNFAAEIVRKIKARRPNHPDWFLRYW